MNFTYRYFFKLGFLDGKEGFIWHFLQGLCYRFLVDAKIFELKKHFGFDKDKIRNWLINTYAPNKLGGGTPTRKETEESIVFIWKHNGMKEVGYAA